MEKKKKRKKKRGQTHFYWRSFEDSPLWPEVPYCDRSSQFPPVKPMSYGTKNVHCHAPLMRRNELRSNETNIGKSGEIRDNDPFLRDRSHSLRTCDPQKFCATRSQMVYTR